MPFIRQPGFHQVGAWGTVLARWGFIIACASDLCDAPTKVRYVHCKDSELCFSKIRMKRLHLLSDGFFASPGLVTEYKAVHSGPEVVGTNSRNDLASNLAGMLFEERTEVTHFVQTESCSGFLFSSFCVRLTRR
jgi:hypothetical protein